MTTVAASGVQIDGDVVSVDVGGVGVVAFHAFALRDACPCAACRHPVSGQRLFESHRVVPRARVASAGLDGGRLAIEWDDGHRSVFDRAWLEAEAHANASGERRRREPALWDATLEPPRERYDDVADSAAALRRLLAAVAEYGFAVLSGVPNVEGSVARVARLFGHVRVTNYGRVFDVAVRVDAANLADTSLPLSLHTDNPYRDPPPTIQLLHCLGSTVSGGETVLADGFRAVAELAARSPEHVELLARHPVRYAYRDEEAELWADMTVIDLDPAGRPRALHVNNRSKGVPSGPPQLVQRWYEAYFELLGLLEDPAAQVVFRLQPGDVVLFDNLRVLHARTGFAGAGTRRLQGCYADRDALLSTLALLSRNEDA